MAWALLTCWLPQHCFRLLVSAAAWLMKVGLSSMLYNVGAEVARRPVIKVQWIKRQFPRPFVVAGCRTLFNAAVTLLRLHVVGWAIAVIV